MKLSEAGESDLLVWFLTEHHGRLTLKARGARKSKKRFMGRLQSFSHHELAFQPKRQGWPLLLRVEPITFHEGLRNNLGGFAAASYAAELLWRMTKEEDPQEGLFRLLASFLDYCEKEPLSPKALCRFHLRLLELLGMQPNWHACMECGRRLDGPDAEGLRLDLGQGGLLCATCPSPSLSATPSLSPALRGVLGALQHKQAHPPASPLQWQGAVELLDRRIGHILGMTPKSRQFLREMVDF